ncbi:hypothetical protein ABZ620_21800 [Nocardiopsis alba]|uniref:hypothetical protein n=1 Tax=Nocardiopsis alba TaxID=53437 RepID=UPI0033C4EC1C
MNWIEDLREERDQLLRMIDLRSSNSSPSVRLSSQSLKRELRDVEKKIESAVRPSLSMRMAGSGVLGNEIKLDSLAPIIKELQETVSSIGQALLGEITEYSSIPAAIREQTSLSLSATNPGSVVLNILSPQGEDTLFPDHGMNSTLAIDSMQRLISLIEAAGETANEEALIDNVYPLGRRTYNHLRDFLKSLAGPEIDADFRLTTPESGERDVSLKSTSARQAIRFLEKVRIAEDTISMSGELKGISSARNSFELVSPEGKITSGKVREDLVPSLRYWFEKPVIAKLQVSRSESRAGRTVRTRYLLIGLAEDQGAAHF